MVIVFHTPSADLDPEVLLHEGYFNRPITGDEHPRSLMSECLCGPWMSTRHRKAFTFDGQVFGTLDGTEKPCLETEERLREAINAVRAYQGREPLPVHVL